MKIFGWMQSKLSGQRFSKLNASKSNQNDHMMHETSKGEDLSDLLTIGTLGNNNNLKDPELDHQEITDEEFIQLQRELNLISCSHSEDNTEESPKHCLPAEKLFDFLDTLEDEQRGNAAVCNKGQDGHLSYNNNKEKKMSKKSATFLLRKAFHSFGRFKLTSPLGDPIRELRLQEKSRFEKILRAILKKKVYPHSRNIPKERMNKIKDQEHQNHPFDCNDSDSGDEDAFESTSEGIKWVKTDSDYIVLEI